MIRPSQQKATAKNCVKIQQTVNMAKHSLFSFLVQELLLELTLTCLWTTQHARSKEHWFFISPYSNVIHIC